MEAFYQRCRTVPFWYRFTWSAAAAARGSLLWDGWLLAYLLALPVGFRSRQDGARLADDDGSFRRRCSI